MAYDFRMLVFMRDAHVHNKLKYMTKKAVHRIKQTKHKKKTIDLAMSNYKFKRIAYVENVIPNALITHLFRYYLVYCGNCCSILIFLLVKRKRANGVRIRKYSY